MMTLLRENQTQQHEVALESKGWKMSEDNGFIHELTECYSRDTSTNAPALCHSLACRAFCLHGPQSKAL